MTFTVFGTTHLGQARCICSSNPEGCPLHQRVLPIDAPDRSVCQYTGELADGLSFPALLPNAAEIAKLTAERDEARQQRDDARAELDNHMGSMKDLGSLVAVLTSQAAMWQSDRDEHRERGDEYADMHQAALATIDELEAEIRELSQRLADAEAARDTANVRGSL